jgi:hypothetical protein
MSMRPHFRIVSAFRNVEAIASGTGIRELKRLRKIYGSARWRKVKGEAEIVFSDGTMATAELHWYEAHGIGRKEIKIKRFWDARV